MLPLTVSSILVGLVLVEDVMSHCVCEASRRFDLGSCLSGSKPAELPEISGPSSMSHTYMASSQ